MTSRQENRKKDIDFLTLSFYPAEQSEAADVFGTASTPNKLPSIRQTALRARSVFTKRNEPATQLRRTHQPHARLPNFD
jgi:hypothetical protein